MKSNSKNLLLFAVLTGFIFRPFDLNCQADSSLSNPSGSKHSLHALAGFGSNMVYLGSTITHDQPYYSTAIIYGYKSQFYLSASTSHLQNTDPFLAFSSLTLNFSHTFNSWFDISADATGYKTAKSLQESLFSDFAFLNVTTGFDWKLIYTKLSLGAMFSDDQKLYFQIRNSRYFETPDFFRGKAYISFDPNINILFGEIIEIKSTSGATRFGLSPPFGHWKKNLNSTDTYTSKPGIINYDFSLPVTINFSNFSIEGETSYFLPGHTISGFPASKGLSFYLTLYLKIL